MDTVEFLESVSSMWNQGNPKYWELMERTYGVSNLVEVMRKLWWGNIYLKYEIEVRETIQQYPFRIFTGDYRRLEDPTYDAGPTKFESALTTSDFRPQFIRGIRDYFLNHFNPKNIVGIYHQNKEGEKVAIERIKDSGKNGVWFLSFPSSLKNSNIDSFTWDVIKTLLRLDEPFVLGYSEFAGSKKVITAYIGEDGLEDVYESPARVISWDFNSGGRLYWNLNQRVHLISRTGMTFNYDDFITFFMNWRRNPL